MKQNVTISLDRQTVRKAKILAARRETSISGLVAAQIEAMVDADDAYERSKHGVARDTLRELWNDGTGLLSTYAMWCVDVTSADVAAAFRIEDEAEIGFWDALIIASASKAGAARLLSEDLNAGQTIGGVLIENPFRALR